MEGGCSTPGALGRSARRPNRPDDLRHTPNLSLLPLAESTGKAFAQSDLSLFEGNLGEQPLDSRI